ncbi:methyltransferase family protein [Salsuginibacillus halophilus]|uniref:Methyltransferase family protein n=1 Tax=Salsuginibacillus halophilus TaxID=517424 RepID=A0A2P8HW31_9BACI|nr:class I SAM-dependent methyltransferase [Salsuginibacillus halophilus]PSL50447.1 methyltransferase family protein [Salsuginibacillus halophilus]
MKAWYQESFQEDYLRIYQHRDEQKAARELETIVESLQLTPGMKVLDLACGNGRHARWLARRGLEVTGVDLSSALLKQAIELTVDLPVQYRRQDMRQPTFTNEMDAVFSLFTSFGYFTEDEENEQVFHHAYQALKPGGQFMFDYLNPAHVKANLVPEDEQEIDGMKVKQSRRVENGYVIKDIIVQEGESRREYMERVKLYDETAVTSMLQAAGFTIQAVYGNYEGTSFHPGSSPRQIYTAVKM